MTEPRQLHAPDPMGKAAHRAAMCIAGADMDLLTACGAAPGLTREQRAEALERFARKWAPLCRAVSELQQAAPNAFRKALEHDARTQDFVETRAA